MDYQPFIEPDILKMGINGLAWATILGGVIAGVVLLFRLGFRWHISRKAITRTVLAGAIMGALGGMMFEGGYATAKANESILITNVHRKYEVGAVEFMQSKHGAVVNPDEEISDYDKVLIKVGGQEYPAYLAYNELTFEPVLADAKTMEPLHDFLRVRNDKPHEGSTP